MEPSVRYHSSKTRILTLYR